MKKPTLILLIFIININAQESANKHYNPFKEGYPASILPFFKAYRPYGFFEQSDVKTAQLDTNIDSIQVYFGLAKNSKGKFYWGGLTIKDSLVGAFAGMNFKETKPNILTDTIEFPLGKSSVEKFAVILNVDTETQSIDYKWIDELGNYSKKLRIYNINKFKSGYRFPHLSFKRLSGETQNLNDFLGKTIVINWWHTRCGPCITEMPGLNSLVKKYSDNKDILFLSIAHNTIDEVKHFLKKREFNYLQSLADKNTIDYFEGGYPKHFILNGKGILEFYTSGGGKNTYQEIDKELKMVLSKK